MAIPLDDSPSPALPPDSWTDLLAEFRHFAVHYRQISPDTVAKQKVYLDRFHAHRHAPPPRELFAALSARSIQQFVFHYAQQYGPGSRRSMQLALRTFLRFARHRRYLPTDLCPAVPTVHQRRLAELPKAIDATVAQRLLASLDITTPAGMRDEALIQLLLAYGVRGIHLRTLELGDIDWRGRSIDFRSTKRGRPIRQPLTIPVGSRIHTCF